MTGSEHLENVCRPWTYLEMFDCKRGEDGRGWDVEQVVLFF